MYVNNNDNNNNSNDNNNNNNNKNNNNNIIIDTVMIPDNLEWRLSIWYRKTFVKPSTDHPRL